MRTTILILAIALGGCTSNTIGSGGDAGLDGGGLDASVAGDLGGPDQGAMSCNPIKQDCPVGQKCSIQTGRMASGAVCVPVTGSVPDGQNCMRAMGADNCAAGLECSRTGSTTMSSVCRKLCAADTDCDQGQKCALLSQNVPDFGICVPTCTPFSNGCGSNTCANLSFAIGSTQNAPIILFTCRTVGTGELFEACNRSSDCDKNLVCDPQAMQCTPLCDMASNSCPVMTDDGGTPLSCQSLGTSLPNDPGICG
jgi:hypothetical protein